jgi:hypothetical protein
MISAMDLEFPPIDILSPPTWFFESVNMEPFFSTVQSLNIAWTALTASEDRQFLHFISSFDRLTQLQIVSHAPADNPEVLPLKSANTLQKLTVACRPGPLLEWFSGQEDLAIQRFIFMHRTIPGELPATVAEMDGKLLLFIADQRDSLTNVRIAFRKAGTLLSPELE